MLKRYMSLWLVANVVLVGLLVILPRATTGEFFDVHAITCVGFQLRRVGPLQEAVVNVHNFGLTTAQVFVRFVDVNEFELKLDHAGIGGFNTFPFFLRSDELPGAGNIGGTQFFIAQVFSGSKHLLVDAENIYDGTSTSGATHRRHITCATVQQLPERPTPPTPKR